MKALTVWQPWASLIAIGVKPYEFRGWPAPGWIVGQRIAIHAGARPVRSAEIAEIIYRLKGPDAWLTCLQPRALPFLEAWHMSPGRLWRSAVVATAIVGAPRPAAEVSGAFGGPVNDSDQDDQSQWAWPMLSVEPIEPPAPAKGAQGFWNWPGVLAPAAT